MQKNNYPKVLLIGNGLNLAFCGESISWRNLVKKGSDVCNVENNTYIDTLLNYTPITFPLEIVLRTNNNCNGFIKELCDKKLLHGHVKSNEYMKLLQKILSMDFEHILTTNYSYEIESAAFSKDLISESTLQNIYKNINGDIAEKRYMLSSCNVVNYLNKETKIWHIHGEARKYSSIIIEHYDYGKLLYKYIDYFEKNKNRYFDCQSKRKDIATKSWLDTFIMGDVYILGFGFNFSEMDMWWLINRKKREKAEHGKTVFYEPESKENKVKTELLKSYSVECRDLGYKSNCEDFWVNNANNFYNDVLSDIENDNNAIEEVAICQNL